jgi:hypothetical protein
LLSLPPSCPPRVGNTNARRVRRHPGELLPTD